MNRSKIFIEVPKVTVSADDSADRSNLRNASMWVKPSPSYAVGDQRVTKRAVHDTAYDVPRR